MAKKKSSAAQPNLSAAEKRKYYERLLAMAAEDDAAFKALSKIKEFKGKIPSAVTPDVIHFVLQYGRRWIPHKRPRHIPKDTDKQCFWNACLISLNENSGLTYVEGLALSSTTDFIIHHAWCVDCQGRVIDNTWETLGKVYFGIPFKREFMTEAMRKSRRTWGSIINDVEHGGTFMKSLADKPEKWLADTTAVRD